ncbi:MAG: twin-arginine translocase TatA/TatE family subunit [Cyanobacteria bacterium TGS_CYA1]|nr:twin-arginine translocase TatA/TatE family subunit [Cyanobacteria bacterium TGS_CYA1]MDX2107627.1 twin-arginine translocase TatA/TatE family subunit [Candidatus Melainabacteria bacterium]
MLSSPVEIAIVFGVGLLLFGPKKLPELGKALGQGIGNFKKSLTDAQSEITTQVKEADREIEEKAKAKAEANQLSSSVSASTSNSEDKPSSG